jgi:aromatic-L-amino-acid/L-tryptophan decarboxylase
MKHALNVCIVHAYPSLELLDMFRGGAYRVLLVTSERYNQFTHQALLAQRGVDLTNGQSVVAACQAFNDAYGIDVALSLNESTVIQSAQVAEALSLAGNSVESARWSRNKYLAFHRYRLAGVDTPKTIALKTPWKDYELAKDELGLPFVVKLADSMNSQGVIKVQNAQEYLVAIYTLRELLNEESLDARGENRNRLAYGASDVSIIAQEYCAGDEFNIDILYKDGETSPLLMFQKAKMDKNYFGEKASFYPPLAPGHIVLEMKESARRAVMALGPSVGCAHVEVKYVAGRGPVIIETGLRPGGGFTVQAASQFYGINLYSELIAILIGGELKSFEVLERDKAVLYGGVLFDRTGALVRVEGLDALKEVKEVSQYVVLTKPGDQVRALPKSAQPHSVYYVLKGPNIDELIGIHEGFQNTIRPIVAEANEYADDASMLENGLAYIGSELISEYASPTRHTAFSEIDPDFEIESLPVRSTPFHEVLRELMADLYSGYSNFLSPRFFAHYSPRPSPPSIVGNLIAHAYNQAPGAWRGGPMSVKKEIEALHWLRQLVGFNSNCGESEPCGVFTSGGTMANATAIKLARDKRLGPGAKRGGLGKDAVRCIIYISGNAHFSIDRAVDFMGFGEESLCRIPLTPDHQMDPRSLERAIDGHLAMGFIPLCIVATVGSASCSDYDDIGALSGIAKDHGIWLHVDAAATGPYASLTELAPVFAGMGSADSVTVDPYKAMYLPFGMGCLLVKEPKLLLSSFDTDPDYFHDDQRLNSFKMSFRGTAPWASLALWLTFKTYGVEKLKSYFRSSLENVRYLAEKLKLMGGVEIYREPVFPTLCFRVVISSRRELNDAHNRLLIEKLCQKGEFFVTGSSTDRGEFIRVCVDNYMTGRDTMDALAEAVMSLSAEIAKTGDRNEFRREEVLI